MTESTIMNPTESTIRLTMPADRERVLCIHRDAFGNEEGETIAKLVAEMLDDPTAEPHYSFVLEQADDMIAHALFSAVEIEPNDVPAQILAPLAVLPEHQRTGVGTMLISESLGQLQTNGFELVFVLGYPGYYSRFGFAPAGLRGFEAPYPIPAKNADAWMVKELKPGAIEGNRGIVRCCTALDQPQYWEE